MRPIDADKVMEEINRIGGHNLCEWETIGVKALIDGQPTADAVPMAEVERLQHILDSYALQYGTVKDQREVMDRIKQETARKIFEEIENIVAADDIHEDLEYEELLGAYAAINRIKRKVLEYKKKYVEVGK